MSSQRVSLTQEQKDYCFQIAQSVIQKNGPSILRQWKQIGRDLLDDALAEMWTRIERGRCDPRLGERRVRGWCCVVLKNLLRSAGRKARRAASYETNESALTSVREGSLLSTMVIDRGCSPAVLAETADFLTAPFSAADLQRVTSWGLADRIELLCLSGLWRMVPSCLWQRWVMKYHRQRQTPAVLPTPDVLAEPTPQQRMSPLALALRMKSNTLTQHWRRKRYLLEELDCARGLRRADEVGAACRGSLSAHGNTYEVADHDWRTQT